MFFIRTAMRWVMLESINGEPYIGELLVSVDT